MKLNSILVAALACLISLPTLAADKDAEKGCRSYGQLANAIVTARESGVPFSREVAAVESMFATAPAKGQGRELVDFLYKEPAGKFLSHEGAVSTMYIDCLARVESSRAGGGGTKSPSEIEVLLAPFETFTGEKLPVLLKKYGLRVEYIERTPVSTMYKRDGDQPGDMLLTLEIKGRPKPMPCGLHKWLAGVDMAEVVVRRGAFLTEAEDLDPILYWAKTSKCSAAYGLAK